VSVAAILMVIACASLMLADSRDLPVPSLNPHIADIEQSSSTALFLSPPATEEADSNAIRSVCSSLIEPLRALGMEARETERATRTVYAVLEALAGLRSEALVNHWTETSARPNDYFSSRVKLLGLDESIEKRVLELGDKASSNAAALAGLRVLIASAQSLSESRKPVIDRIGNDFYVGRGTDFMQLMPSEVSTVTIVPTWTPSVSVIDGKRQIFTDSDRAVNVCIPVRMDGAGDCWLHLRLMEHVGSGAWYVDLVMIYIVQPEGKMVPTVLLTFF
jgi:hypothetical protein